MSLHDTTSKVQGGSLNLQLLVKWGTIVVIHMTPIYMDVMGYHIVIIIVITICSSILFLCFGGYTSVYLWGRLAPKLRKEEFVSCITEQSSSSQLGFSINQSSKIFCYLLILWSIIYPIFPSSSLMSHNIAF